MQQKCSYQLPGIVNPAYTFFFSSPLIQLGLKDFGFDCAPQSCSNMGCSQDTTFHSCLLCFSLTAAQHCPAQEDDTPIPFCPCRTSTTLLHPQVTWPQTWHPQTRTSTLEHQEINFICTLTQSHTWDLGANNKKTPQNTPNPKNHLLEKVWSFLVTKAPKSTIKKNFTGLVTSLEKMYQVLNMWVGSCRVCPM